MTNKIVWDAGDFAELAARIKDVESRLDKLERPWVDARIAELERQVGDLQAANSRYLERARAAEAALQDELDNRKEGY